MSSGVTEIPKETQRQDLTTIGQWTNGLTCAGIICRSILSVMPFVYILGADNWIILGFVIAYTLLFGILTLFYLAVFGVSLTRGMTSQKIFCETSVSWNPLRHFYAAFIFTVIDYASNLIFWYIWLYRNKDYLDSPSNSNTPDANTAGFFPFQMLCGAFIFSTVISLIFYFNLVRSLWAQKQSLTKTADLTTSKELKPAYGQFSTNRAYTNIDLRATPKTVSQSSGIVRLFTAFGAIYYIVMIVYLLIYFYHLFRDKTEMNYTVLTVFLWTAFLFWILQLVAYYIGFGKNSVQKLFLTAEPDDNIATIESNYEVNADMGTTFLCGFFLFFYNIVFAAYFYDMRDRPEFSWDSVPKFDPFAIVQSPLFYVWVTLAALNTGAFPFIVYNAVTFTFVAAGGSPLMEDELDTEETGAENESLVKKQGGEKIVAETKPHYLVIIYISVMAVIWGTFYGFVINAMVGGHFLAEFSFPVTVTFGIVFGLLILVIVLLFILSSRETQNYGRMNNILAKVNSMNKSWHLAIYRNTVAVPVTFILQVVILSVTNYNYFEKHTFSEWQCIRPIDISAPPPYSSCNIYWAAAILALYCTLLVYLVCIINAYSSASVKVLINKQIKLLRKKEKQVN